MKSPRAKSASNVVAAPELRPQRRATSAARDALRGALVGMSTLPDALYGAQTGMAEARRNASAYLAAQTAPP